MKIIRREESVKLIFLPKKILIFPSSHYIAIIRNENYLSFLDNVHELKKLVERSHDFELFTERYPQDSFEFIAKDPFFHPCRLIQSLQHHQPILKLLKSRYAPRL